MNYMFEYCSKGFEACWTWFEWIPWWQKIVLVFLLYLIIFLALRIFYWITKDFHPE